MNARNTAVGTYVNVVPLSSTVPYPSENAEEDATSESPRTHRSVATT